MRLGWSLVREDTMTEYEMATLFTQMSDNLGTQLTNFLTIASLYLGAGYLVAHRMSLPAAIVFTGMFLIVNLGLIVLIFNSTRSWMGLAREMQGAAGRGGGLAWHQVADMPSWVQSTMPVNSLLLLFAVVAGAVYFFFSSRSASLKAEARAAAKTTALTADTAPPREAAPVS